VKIDGVDVDDKYVNMSDEMLHEELERVRVKPGENFNNIGDSRRKEIFDLIVVTTSRKSYMAKYPPKKNPDQYQTSQKSNKSLLGSIAGAVFGKMLDNQLDQYGIDGRGMNNSEKWNAAYDEFKKR